MINITPKLPSKVQFVTDYSFPLVNTLCEKTNTERFVGGRKGFNKEYLFTWLLVKKVTNWDYRTIASMAGVSHPTLIRANTLFLKKGIYEKVLMSLVGKAYNLGLLKGFYAAMDSSFVHTFSKKGELGSEGWNEYKKGYGFKLHLLIDAESKFPLSVKITNGLASDNTLAVSLLKMAKPYLKKGGYILADKGYDDAALVTWINKILKDKAAIPIRKYKRGKNYSWKGRFENFKARAKGRCIKKSIYNRRSSVERIFSSLKRTYHLGKEETRGILNFAKNTYLALICYILKGFWIAGIR
ncbi:transposase [Patescibacteria group bacterium]|nr:transposase [Patescibacteria group bacterium]